MRCRWRRGSSSICKKFDTVVFPANASPPEMQLRCAGSFDSSEATVADHEDGGPLPSRKPELSDPALPRHWVPAFAGTPKYQA
jgi:hypothetical protein